MSFEAVIFDFDGTLVDTMPLHYEAYRLVFAEVGIELTSKDFFANVGGNAREAIPKFLGGRNCPISVAELHARKKAIVSQVFAESTPAPLETSKLLPLLSEKYPLAIASSGSRQGIQLILNRLGWQHYFKTVVTGEDAANGKPAPDLFLRAAQQLGVRPKKCFVFEDTSAGVEAAVRAGMQVFDVRIASTSGTVLGID